MGARDTSFSDAAGILAQAAARAQAVAPFLDTFTVDAPHALIDVVAWCMATSGTVSAHNGHVVIQGGVVQTPTGYGASVRRVQYTAHPMGDATTAARGPSVPDGGISAASLGVLCAQLLACGVNMWSGWVVS